jgi:cation:H+ antiporter
MLLALLLLAAGTVLVAAGAEAAVRGAARFALATGVPAFVLGALLFGIDFEGTAGSLVAAGRGQTALAAGEAYGTVIFLFSAAFGVALLVSRKPVASPSPLMVIAPALTLVASALVLEDRFVSRPEGAFLILVYAGYVTIVIADQSAVQNRATRLEEEASEVRGGARRAAIVAVVGLAALFGGAWLLVAGGIRILARTGLEAGFVGAAIVATLASLDEVLLEVLPIRRGRPDLATGNLLGTLAAFTSFVPGLAALVRPLQVDGAGAVAFIAAAALYTLVAMSLLVRQRAWRILGLVTVAAYAAWLVYAASL